MVTVRTKTAGFLEGKVKAGEHVRRGELLACIVDCYEGTIIEEIHAPVEGTVLFAHAEARAYQNTAVYKLIPEKEDW